MQEEFALSTQGVRATGRKWNIGERQRKEACERQAQNCPKKIKKLQIEKNKRKTEHGTPNNEICHRVKRQWIWWCESKLARCLCLPSDTDLNKNIYLYDICSKKNNLADLISSKIFIGFLHCSLFHSKNNFMNRVSKIFKY